MGPGGDFSGIVLLMLAPELDANPLVFMSPG
jgi:hypothetical protein